MKINFKDKKLLAFDLDGTLTLSKSKIKKKMKKLLLDLSNFYFIFIIGGGRKKEIERQIEDLRDYVFLGAVSGTRIYKKGKLILKEKNMTKKQIELIKKNLKFYLKSLKLNFKTFGRRIDFRGSQLTFSFLGVKAPLEEKLKFSKLDEKIKIRKKLIYYMKKRLKNIDSSIGGLTSVDFNLKNQNKGSMILKLAKFLGIKKREILFFGDKIFPYGNDYSVFKKGIECILVKNPEETFKILKKIYGYFKNNN